MTSGSETVQLAISASPEEWRPHIGRWIEMDITGTTGRAVRNVLLVGVESTDDRPCVLLLKLPADESQSMHAAIAAKREE